MDGLHQLSVNGVSMIKSYRTFNLKVSNVNFEIILRVSIISKFGESFQQSVFNSWAVINLYYDSGFCAIFTIGTFLKKFQKFCVMRNPIVYQVNESRKSLNVWRSDLVNIVTIITHVSTLGKHSTSSRPGQRTPIITLFLIMIVLHAVAVFKIVSLWQRHIAAYYTLCVIFWFKERMLISSEHLTAPVGVVVLLARHAIDRGSNPTHRRIAQWWKK